MVDMAILTMVVTTTHMITKPPTMDMANLTMLLAMQKVQDQAFITLKIICPLMDTQEYILNTKHQKKINMILIHQEALLKAHTCKTMQEVMMTTEISLFQRLNTRSQQQHFPLAATASKASKGSLKTLVKVPTLKSKGLKERRGSIKTLKKVLMDKILNPEIPATSPRTSGLRYEGLLKQHPLRDFDIVGELKQWAQDWAWSQGFALSVKSSKPNRNVYLKCSHGGVSFSKARSAERTSSTRRTGCKYEVSGRWMQSTHNHEPAPAISGLSTHRRFDQKGLEEYNEPDTGAILKDVYNAKTKLVRAQISGRTPLEHLYYELIWSNYLYESKKDGNNTLTHLFFAHPESIRLAQIYHHVVSPSSYYSFLFSEVRKRRR
ncbi:hypothetical protein PPACK8108_LOCUS5421 [Phakopsora pachyrhizi]|uniref:FAR1 domain-containing protein n=1 Tax=Phakopsora pachyrhizi TaxID=170000 RepID=A0AAV0AQW1_PHAPC|nr:hypothetical protein PPACK8108_LOCUS5421 [Phakopsora pachyrhizi]